MTRTLTATFFAAFAFHYLPFPATAQELVFDVASITPCKPGTPAPEMEHTGIANFTAPGGRFTARATTVSFLLEWAYSIQPLQHSDGPGWLASDRFDIVAKAGHDATDNEMKQMVRALLTERFRLKMRRESKEMSAYVISIGKSSPKLSTPKDGEAHAMRFTVQPGPDQKTMTYHVIATRYSLPQLADVFARRLDKVIVNNTGMDGEYDFTLDLTPDESRPSPMDQSLLLAAMREQLGLNVQSQKAMVDFYAIDRADKTETAN
jgi:uncharacterized protein (TIGR03435 family)